jgi:hypothetical protein
VAKVSEYPKYGYWVTKWVNVAWVGVGEDTDRSDSDCSVKIFQDASRKTFLGFGEAIRCTIYKTLLNMRITNIATQGQKTAMNGLTYITRNLRL